MRELFCGPAFGGAAFLNNKKSMIKIYKIVNGKSVEYHPKPKAKAVKPEHVSDAWKQKRPRTRRVAPDTDKN